MPALSFDGDIQIDKPGPYRFYTQSSDGSLLYINGTLVVNNDGQHEVRIVSNTYNFPSPGKYPIRSLYYNQAATQTFIVSYNEGTTDNFLLSNMIPDNKLLLPAESNTSSARFSSMAYSPPADANKKKNESTWYEYYKDQITVDTTKTNVLVYPNPFDTKIHLSFLKEMGSQQVGLYDMITGQAISMQVVNTRELEAVLEFPNIPPGLYALRVGNASFKLIKRN